MDKKERESFTQQGKEGVVSILQYFIFITSIFFLSSLMFAIEFPPSQQENKIPVSEYRIGAKDLLEITVFELPELNQTVRVSEDGSISLSLIGRVEVAGLTSQELEKKLASVLDQQYTKVAHVTVFIREYQKVAVLGAVGSPGMYELAGPTTLLQIIAQAGGLTEQAKKEIFIDRQETDGQQTRIKVNLEDLMIDGKQGLNIELQPKDVVTVPIDRILNVFIYGEVRSPGVISYMSSKKITLLQAITQAGGPTDWAKESRVMIKRIDRETGEEKTIRVNLNAIIRGKADDIVLEEGDVVIVP